MHLPWRPSYLRRRLLFSLSATFTLVIVAIETLLAVSDTNSGIASASPNQHYLWTYGPTAFLILVAAVWSRIEYQSKLVAPWIRLSRHPSDPKTTLLVDYLSDVRGGDVFKALRNRDFTVAITSIVAIFIKLLIVISTGLFTLSWTQVRHESWPMVVQDRFVDSGSRLANTDTLALYIIQGLRKENLSYPDGLSDTYAFQTVRADVSDTAEIHVTVDGFENSLECKPAELTLSVSSSGPTQLNVNITSPDCNMANVGLLTPPGSTENGWPCADYPSVASCNLVFARFVQTQCVGTTDDAGKRVLVVFGDVAYSLDHSKDVKDDLGKTLFGYRAQLYRSAQLLCVPTYGITKLDVVRNGTKTLRVAAVPGATSRTLDSVNAWNIMEAHYSMYGGDTTSTVYPTIDGRNLSNAILDVDPCMEVAMTGQLAAIGPLDSLFDPKSLQQLATNYYRQLAAIVAKRSLMEPTSAETQGTIVMYENRLIIRNWAVQWMAGLAAACAVHTAAASFFVPRAGILPCSPSTLSGIASLVAHSHDLLAMLRFSGAAHAKVLERPLLTSSFKSMAVVDPRSNHSHFAILATQHVTNPRSQTFPQISSEHRHPFLLQPASRLALCLVLIGVIVTLELTLRKSNTESGLGDVGDDTYIHYTWTTVPALFLGALSVILSAVDFQIRSLAPYTALKQTVTAMAFKSLDFMDMSIPRTIFKEVQSANIAALAATSAFFVGSLLTLFVSSLFQPVTVAITLPITLQANQTVPLYAHFEDPLAASLILESNLSYPRFTYGDLAFAPLVPTLSLPADGSINTAVITINAVVPAVRSILSCRIYDTSKIRTNLFLNVTDLQLGPNFGHHPLGITIEGEDCSLEFTYNGVLYNQVVYTLPNMTYFGLASSSSIPNTFGCSELLYTWGKIDYSARPVVQHIAALGCNESIEALSVSTTFTGTSLNIDPAHPPQPLEATANTVISPPSRESLSTIYSPLAQNNTMPNILDSFFAMLTSSPWAIPLSTLGDPTANEAVLAAVKNLHGIIRAQTLVLQFYPDDAISDDTVLRRDWAGRRDTGPNPDPNPNLKSNATNGTITPITTGNSTSSSNNNNNNSSSSSTNSSSPPLTPPTYTYNGTVSTPPGEGRRRVFQDPTSTRILQALLATTLVLVGVNWVCMPHTDVLPRSPTMIASAVALLAGGNLFEGQWFAGSELDADSNSGLDSNAVSLRALLGAGSSIADVCGDEGEVKDKRG